MNSFTKEWCVIFNSQANDGGAAILWGDIKEQLQNSNIDFIYYFTESKKHAIELTQYAIQKGYRKFIAVGGGGTLNEVVNGIMIQKVCPTQDIVLTNIPTGGFCDWAHHFNIDKDIRKWIPQIKNLTVQPHDIGVFTYQSHGQKETAYFLGFLGMGISASVVKEINDESLSLTDKSNLLRHVVKSGFSFHKDKLRLIYDDKIIERNFLYLHASIDSYAAGFRFLPQGERKFGELYITHNIKSMPYKNLMGMYYNLFVRKKLAGKSVEHFTTKNCYIEPTGDEPCYVQADGEFFGQAPCEINIIPKAIKVIVP